MKVFGILVRCIAVGAICIVSSALYIANANAVNERVLLRVSGTCPVTHLDGLFAGACYHWNGSGHSSALQDDSGALVEATVFCPQHWEVLNVNRAGGGVITGFCGDGAGSVLVGTQAMLAVTRPDTEQTRIILIIANGIAFILGMGFGWRQSLAPPRFLMD